MSVNKDKERCDLFLCVRTKQKEQETDGLKTLLIDWRINRLEELKPLLTQPATLQVPCKEMWRALIKSGLLLINT